MASLDATSATAGEGFTGAASGHATGMLSAAAAVVFATAALL